MKKWRGARSLFFLTVGFFLLAAVSRTRVQVIMPSYPVVDRYEEMTVVARTESWEIDRGFVGEAWLWTDGPYLRPFHVAFTPKDRGVLRTPAVLNLPGLWRIEAYQLTGFIHTWSNPILAVPADYPGPRLFFGKFQDCEEPGLDFCLTEELPGPPPESGSVSARGRPLKLRLLKKTLGAETWYLLPAPSVATDLTPRIKSASGSELARLMTEKKDQLVIFVEGDSPSSSPLSPILLLSPSRSGASWVSAVAAIWREAPGRAVVPDGNALLAVWARDEEPESLWRALKNQVFYATWKDRIIVDWSGEAVRFFPAYRSGSFLLAGEGPRLQVNVLAWTGKEFTKILSRQTDDFYLLLDPRELSSTKAENLFLEVLEPGSPRSGHALAGPLRFSF